MGSEALEYVCTQKASLSPPPHVCLVNKSHHSYMTLTTLRVEAGQTSGFVSQQTVQLSGSGSIGLGPSLPADSTTPAQSDSRGKNLKTFNSF